MTSRFLDPTDEVVTLGGGAQFYEAPSGASVQAGSGSDTVEAGAGDVTVTGGSGQLTFIGGSLASSVTGGAGSLTIFGGSGGGSLSGGAAGHSVLISQSVDLGFPASTTLTGAAAGDLLFGAAIGNDVLTAGAGRETLIAGGGDDTITGGSTAGCLIFTGASSGPPFQGYGLFSSNFEVQGGAAGRDTIVGGSAGLEVEARNGDAVFAGTGQVRVLGSDAGAADSIIGGSGSLDVFGQGGNMLVACGSGTSNLMLGSGASLVFGGSGRVTVTAGSGSAQILLGSGGNFTERNLVIEGSGAVVYDVVASLPGGFTGIRGFRPGTDKVELFGYQPSAVTASTAGTTTTLHFTDGKVINLPGVTSLGSSLIFG